MKHHLTKLTPLFALLLLLAPAVRADDKQAIEPYEAWFVMNMGGQKAGYMHITLKQVGEEIINTSEMKIAIKRGNLDMAIEQSSRFVETLDHRPVRSESSMALGAMATTTRIDFGEDKWKLTTASAGRENTSEVDPPEDEWLTPGGLSAVMEAAIARGDKEITVRTLDSSLGTQPVEITMKRGQSADIEVFGKVVPATRWAMTISAMPGIEIEQWTDAAGQPVRQVMAMMPGMEMEMLLADKELALAEFDAPEMLAASLITPDKPIKNPRNLKRGVFDLVSPGLKEALGDAVVNDGYQRAEWKDENTLRVTIDLDRLVKHHIPTKDHSPGRGKFGSAYLEATTMLNHEDGAVQDLVKKVLQDIDIPAVQGGEDRRKAASAIRDAVREHIEAKDLSVGFASASETARTGQGDCTEHGCLLAAMLRGAGIPSRTVTGLVYADQFAGHEHVFGFHMWTQAWLPSDEGVYHWIDLDAAAPGEINGFDATHIALSTSAMKDGETFNDMVTMLPLMQGLEIRVVEAEWAE